MLLKKSGKTPGTRHQLLVDKSILSKKTNLKFLVKRIPKNSGRNFLGHITVRHRGGGNKKLYRIVNFSSNPFQGIVISIEYDPYRSAFISCIFDQKNYSFFYVLTNEQLYVGSLIECGLKGDCRIGSRFQLRFINPGSLISMVSHFSTSKGLFARSAGTFCQVLERDSHFCKVKIPSGKILTLSSSCFATIGAISNMQHRLRILGKAGYSRNLGFRPKVRGVAMNPVDHPHGGGEGKTSGGRPSVTPWGRPTKGQPTKKKIKKNV